ncbi:MAG: glyoxylate/hydroxypyruvate reductase A [Sneathiella sp.]
MKAPIPVTGQISKDEAGRWLQELSARLPDERLIWLDDISEADCQAAEIAIVANPDPNEIAKLTNLKWVHSVWAGVERLVADLGDQPFEIVRLIDPELARTMAEAVLSWCLYLHRDMPAYARLQRDHKWAELPYSKPSQKTVGVLGLGALGIAAAQLLKQFGFHVQGWSRTQKDLPGIETFQGPRGLEQMIGQSDLLVCLLPLTEGTRHLLDFDLLKKACPGASLINFGRGPVVVTDDLVTLLDQGPLDHAVLDVFDQEPLPENSLLWDHPKITILPHISAPTDVLTASDIVASNIKQYRRTGQLPPVVDKKFGY